MTDIDVAELELQRNSLNEQIAEVEKSEEDMTEQYQDYQKKTEDLLTLKMRLTDMERRANEDNNTARRKYADELADIEDDIASAEREIRALERNIADGMATISAYEKKRKELLSDWEEENAKVYSDNLEMDESNTICPTCGQHYPEDKIAEIRANFEQTKADAKEKWEKQHKERLDSIVTDGNGYKTLICSMQSKVDSANQELAAKRSYLVGIQMDKNKTSNLLSELPDKIDISDNPEYQELSEQIAQKEKMLDSANSGAEMRQQLRIKKIGLKEELLEVEKKITSADNYAKEKRMEELQQEMDEVANKVNEQEKMIYLLEEFTKAKMTMISKVINEKFSIVNWKLFDKQINGALVECCECVVNGVPFSTLNTGHRIVAGLDIVNALSELYGVVAPIFFDNAEAVNEFNLPESAAQMILLVVSDDNEMKTEVA